MEILERHIPQVIEEPYRSRGKKYFMDGDVVIQDESDKHISAKVVGSGVYHVEITWNGVLPMGTCTCPAYGNWGPCKHIAATLFAAANGGTRLRGSPEARGRVSESTRLETKLMKLSKRELIRLLLKYAAIDGEMFYELEDECDY